MTSRIENFYEEFIYKRTYSRWDYNEGRRENWEETINRYFDFLRPRVPENQLKNFDRAKDFVMEKKVMPSMRALWSAGPALEKENIAAYNCAYITVDNPRSFSEALYILMNGTGVGFSVERQYIASMPVLPDKLENVSKKIVFKDSKKGWAEGYDQFIHALYDGKVMECDFSEIRPEGSILKTFGGRASGPEPLKSLIKFTTNLFSNAIDNNEKRLHSIECHDIMCKVAEIVVVGGVRRSAMISLSNPTDMNMRDAKEGNAWMESQSQRFLANNSIAFTDKPKMAQFLEEWMALMKSGTGERGIFNRESATAIVKGNSRRKRQWTHINVTTGEIETLDGEFGCNPCSEIILRPYEFCNLTEVVVRPGDTMSDLTEKVKFATILGVLQSTLTDFRFLNENWKNNCEEERLLGVSLTGMMDHHILSNEVKKERMEDWLTAMKDTAIAVAKKWSKALNINVPVAITCTKPSGTVSQLVGSASGLHPRYAPHYIRRVRVSKSDAVCKYLMDKDIPWNPEVNQTVENFTTAVFDFPIKAPKKAIFRNDKNALQQLEHWKLVQEFWCEHKPSITVYVRDSEWLEVGSWIYKNWDCVSGISFLPFDGGTYKLAPYQEITEDEYKELCKKFQKGLDFEGLTAYEKEDYTEGAGNFACSSGSCEI